MQWLVTLLVENVWKETMVYLKARLHRRFLSRNSWSIQFLSRWSCNFKIARVNQLRVHRDFSAICRRDIAGVSNVLETWCNFWLNCDKSWITTDPSGAGFCQARLKFVFVRTDKNTRRRRNFLFSYGTCLYQTSSTDYQRKDKRARLAIHWKK